MIFNSVTFLIFFVLVLGAFWVLSTRARLWMLLGSSLLFYGFWRVEFVPLMLVSAFTDYWVSHRLTGVDDPKARRRLLYLSLGVNLGLLFYFKYLYFFTENVAAGLGLLGLDWSPDLWEITLPLGISFYTFQTISYTVDVYRRHRPPIDDWVLYATYVTFFPQLIAGPVLRAHEVVDQLAQRAALRWDDLAAGAQRIAIGLFLKVGLADNIAPMVDAGFSSPLDLLTALDIWTLAFLFGFQIYFDFSAYSSIAIGCARMMGIRFPENFNFPYFATSARDFWRRWHISLSSWIRDYLYLPLTGVEVREPGSKGGLEVASRQRRDGALLLTWAIMGLWHGARWTFVLWGLYHAVWVLAGRWLAPVTDRLPGLIRRGLAWPTSLAVAMLGWLPFRMESVPDTLLAFQTLLTPSAYGRLGLRENTYLVAALLMVAMVLCYLAHTRLIPRLTARPKLMRPLAAAFFGVVVFVDFVYLRPINQFIYFQF